MLVSPDRHQAQASELIDTRRVAEVADRYGWDATWDWEADPPRTVGRKARLRCPSANSQIGF
jgi:hypothetical protein